MKISTNFKQYSPSSDTNLKHFMKSKVSIPCAQKPATFPHFGPGKYNPQPQCISTSNQHLGFQSGIFPSRFPIKTLYAFFFSFMPHTLPVSQQFCPTVCYITGEKTEDSNSQVHRYLASSKFCISHTVLNSFHVWKEKCIERQTKLKISLVKNNKLTSPFWCNGHLQSTIHTGYCQHNSHK